MADWQRNEVRNGIKPTDATEVRVGDRRVDGRVVTKTRLSKSGRTTYLSHDRGSEESVPSSCAVLIVAATSPTVRS